MDPCRHEACPGRAGRHPEPSDAWLWGDPSCEALTGSERAVDRAPKWIPIAEVRHHRFGERLHRRSRRAVASRYRRGRRTRHERRGIPGNPGNLAISSKNERSGDRETKPQATTRCARRDVERNASARWYRQPKETKRGGTDGKESECVVVPMKRGNQTRETPRREGRTGIRNRRTERRPGHRARCQAPRCSLVNAA